MRYNPALFRWEGNENALAPFDAPVSSPALSLNQASLGYPGKPETPRPALITNINASQGVQVVGGMVFDPQRMCWLKIGASGPGGAGGASESVDLDDEDDPFADVPDLEEGPAKTDGDKSDNDATRTSGIGLADEWLVGEEFDVGPEFVRRQREEEERWRRKVEAWVGAKRNEEMDDGGWRWGIREVVMSAR
jgi:hypothetical protein